MSEIKHWKIIETFETKFETLIYSRNEQWASLVVDSGTGVSASSPGQLRQLNTDTGLYVGKWINLNHTNLNS